MKLPLLSIVFLLFFSIAAQSQNVYSIKGSVVDTVSNLRLKNTTVSVLHSKDSTLVRFTRVNESGTFSISNLPKGKLFLLITYPGYADYVEHFNLDSTKTSVDFGTLKMTLKATLLANVIIKAKAAAVKIKGDTTEFNASSFVVQPNAKVEDLLKQMPGIQVDKDGKITAQGKAVNKVLVDGEEFFGDDPTLVTKNIRADMVDKVQLYDKSSDQSAFTGIDDGKKTKTINIKLKEDKKNGYFGKLDAGGGTDGYYQEQLMFNAFQGKKKFSVYGTLANTGVVGLGWGDNSKYGGVEFEAVDGGLAFSSDAVGNGLDSYDGQYNDQGIPHVRNGGAHYDTKWNSDKESINANYKIGAINVDGTRNTLSQNNLSTGVITSNSDESFHNYLFRQKADGVYKIKLDSTSDLKVSIDGTIKNNQTQSDFVAKSLRGDDVMLTGSDRNLSNEGHDKLLNAKLLYTKKLKKLGRTISLNLSEAYKQAETKGYLKSQIDFFNAAGTKDSSQVINQYKTSLVKSAVFNANVVYTEPITKTVSLIVNYGVGINNSTANRQSFNLSPTGTYNTLDSLYSNDYRFNQLSNQVGAIINYKKNKTLLNFGTKVTDVNFDQTNLYDNSTLKRTFTSWNPQLKYRYSFSQQQVLDVNYNGITKQPDISQIQPVVINTDPLNITLGNPNLRPSFQHTVDVNYYSNKVIKGRFLYVGGSYSLYTNSIVNNMTTDSAGKNTSQAVNLTGKNTTLANAYVGLDQKINPLDLTAGLNLNYNNSISYSYTNGVLNKSTLTTYSPAINFYKTKLKKFDINGSFGPTYTINQSSLQQDINSNGWGARGYLNVYIYLPGNFAVSTNDNYEYQGKTKSFNTDFNKLIINTAISKKFLKSQGLKILLSANDLLNQNVGFSRSASAGMMTQNSYTTIKRYFMASISWDFSQMGGAAPKK